MYAGENKTPDIDGKNNGSSLKYNQNCLDIAYKNAYGNASGKPTSSSDFKNYKCYINGKVVPCTSMSEDGQTKKAEADYQANLLLSQTTRIEGSFYVNESYGTTLENFDGIKVLGQTWHLSDYQEPTTTIPAYGGVQQFSWDSKHGGRTLIGFPLRVNKVTEATTISVTCNGKTVKFSRPQFYQDGPEPHITFLAKGDVFDLANSVGQTLSFTVTWN